MSAAPSDRREYFRQYMKARRMSRHPVYIENIEPIPYTLMNRYRKQTGLSVDAIVNEALTAYLTPLVK